MIAFIPGREPEILVVIALLVSGGSQLPKLARSLTEAKTEAPKSPEGANDDDTGP